MAKQERIKVDPKDLFLDTVDPVTRSAVMKSDMWPIVLSVYSTTEQRAKVAAYGSTLQEKIIHMATDQGFSVCAIARTAAGFTEDVTYEYRFMSADYYLTGSDTNVTHNYTTRMTSSKPKYIANNLRATSVHDAKVKLMHDLTHALSAPSRMIHSTLDMMIEHFAGGWSKSSMPEVRIEPDLATELVKAQFSEDKYSIPPAQAQRLRGVYLDYLGEMNRFNAFVDRVAAFFTTDKWILVPDALGGVILGAVSNHAIQVALENYKKHGELVANDSFSYAVPVVPFKKYKNMDDIPADISSELNIALTMLKAHTNTQQGLPRVVENKLWESIEAVGVHHYRIGRTTFYILSK